MTMQSHVNVYRKILSKRLKRFDVCIQYERFRLFYVDYIHTYIHT